MQKKLYILDLWSLQGSYVVWKSGNGREYENRDFKAWKGGEFDFQVWKMNDLRRDHRYIANFKLRVMRLQYEREPAGLDWSLPVMAGIEGNDDARYVWVLKKLRLGLERVGKRS